MNILEIPFVKLLNITQDENKLSLNEKKTLLNHLETTHAGAIYTLGETQSGLYLQNLFPSLQDKVIPILRDSKIKYKKPALGNLSASATCTEETRKKFQKIFEKKKRASIEITVNILNKDEEIIAIASFTWFIQSI